MTTLVWDTVGDRVYQTGIDRGVLYLSDDNVVVWNGLTSVEEYFAQERKSFFLDGIKYLEVVSPNNYSGRLKAITYPDEFEEVIGGIWQDGILVHDQNPKIFGLSYRTLIGDDVNELSRGYRIHLFYNLLAISDTNVFNTLSSQPENTEFGWEISGIPNFVEGYRPTIHLTLDSTKMDPTRLAELETILYGTTEVDPRLPSVPEVLGIDEGVMTTYLLLQNDAENTDSPNIWNNFEEVSELYIEINLAVFNFDPESGSYPINIAVLGSDSTGGLATNFVFFFGSGDSGPERMWGYGFAEGDDSYVQGGTLLPETIYKIEFHIMNTGIISSGPGAGEVGWSAEIRVDGTTIDTITGYDTGNDGKLRSLNFSGNGSLAINEQRYYSVKLGTTGWGATDIFEADYAEGVTTTIPGPWTGSYVGSGILDIITS